MTDEISEVPAEELVPGDVVGYEAGDKVPADGRIIVSATLEIEESGLTGESAPVSKVVQAVEGDEVALGDRIDMAYMNSQVTRGRGEMIVTATGMSTEVGHISGMLSGVEQEKTPLAKQLDQLTIIITIMAAAALDRDHPHRPRPRRRLRRPLLHRHQPRRSRRSRRVCRRSSRCCCRSARRLLRRRERSSSA